MCYCCFCHQSPNIRFFIKQVVTGFPVIVSFMVFLAVSILFFIRFSYSFAHAEDNPFDRLRDETLSFFKPMEGSITSFEETEAIINLGAKDGVKAGMRFRILREGAPFTHPVTREPLGKIESLIGMLEIKRVDTDFSEGEIIKGEPQEGDKVRISGIKMDLLFYQSGNTDWYLADTYYRKLKDSERFNMIDTALETDDPARVIEEARNLNADIVLFLTSEASESGTVLIQRLMWVSDGHKFSEIKTEIDSSYTEEMKLGKEFLMPYQKDPWLKINVSSEARLITTADIDGDGNKEIILSTGKNVNAFIFGVELQPAAGGVRIEGSPSDDHLWLDAIDSNGNGRDEILITSMKGNNVVSFIFELRDSEFTLLFEDDIYLRKLGHKLIGQAFSRTEGYYGEVFAILYENGEYKKDKALGLPEGVNIYDFIYIDDPQRGILLLAYDEDGFLTLYDDKDSMIWKRNESTGGFLRTFEKYSPTVMVDKGEWAVKDRLFNLNGKISFVIRVPLLGIVKGLGYKSSQVKTLWWNGVSAEEGTLIDDVKGSILDYTVTDDKIIILKSPVLGIKPGNILKGENPLGAELYIYLLKGI